MSASGDYTSDIPLMMHYNCVYSFTLLGKRWVNLLFITEGKKNEIVDRLWLKARKEG